MRAEMRITRRGGSGAVAATAKPYRSPPSRIGRHERRTERACRGGVPYGRWRPGSTRAAAHRHRRRARSRRRRSVGAPDPPTLVVDVDPWSFVVLAAAACVAVAVFAVASTAGDVLTGIGVGVLVGVALSPVVGAVAAAVVDVPGPGGHGRRRRADRRRSRPSSRSSPRRPCRSCRTSATSCPRRSSDFYTWPIVGPRLEDADAAGRVEEWIDDAPADIDDATLADFGERLIGGVLSAVVVLITALGVMVDGGVVVRQVPRPRARSTSRAAGRPAGPHRLRHVRQLLRGLAVRGRARGVRDPVHRPAARRAAGARRRPVDHAHQPHPADRRLPRRRVLRAAGADRGAGRRP